MNAREHGQNIIARIDAGRLASSRLLQMLDLGLDASEIIREVAPGLSPVAVEAAAQLANLAAFDHAALSLLLAGLVPDATLAGLEIREAPARQGSFQDQQSKKRQAQS